MLAAGYAERERIKQEQGNVLLFWFLLSALITSSSALFFPCCVSGLILIIWEQFSNEFHCCCGREFFLLGFLISSFRFWSMYPWIISMKAAEVDKSSTFTASNLRYVVPRYVFPIRTSLRICRLKKKNWKHCHLVFEFTGVGMREIGLWNKKPADKIGFPLKT